MKKKKRCTFTYIYNKNIQKHLHTWVLKTYNALDEGSFVPVSHVVVSGDVEMHYCANMLFFL